MSHTSTDQSIAASPEYIARMNMRRATLKSPYRTMALKEGSRKAFSYGTGIDSYYTTESFFVCVAGIGDVLRFKNRSWADKAARLISNAPSWRLELDRIRETFKSCPDHPALAA